MDRGMSLLLRVNLVGAVTPSLALVMPVSRCSPVRATSAHVHAGPFAGGSRATIRSLRSPTFAPQWLIRDLLPLPPSGGIPREATRSLSPPSSAALRAKAAGRSLRRSKNAIKVAMVAGLDKATGDHHGSDWHLHPRRRWILQRHHQDALAQHQGALPSGRTVREREGSEPARNGRQRRDRCRVAADLTTARQRRHGLALSCFPKGTIAAPQNLSCAPLLFRLRVHAMSASTPNPT